MANCGKFHTLFGHLATLHKVLFTFFGIVFCSKFLENCNLHIFFAKFGIYFDRKVTQKCQKENLESQTGWFKNLHYISFTKWTNFYVLKLKDNPNRLKKPVPNRFGSKSVISINDIKISGGTSTALVDVR